ncbi:MAG TPA: hypothetical protein VF708_12250 [Pyrinomonadaceae bacterium]|jgi:hypothetical protein
MSADATETTANSTAAPVAKEAPTAQQQSQPGVPKKIVNAQTVCNEKNEKGKLCNGHLKQLRTGGEEAEKHLRGDDVLFKCQTCGTLYMGPPLGHVRDPQKQSRFVEKELTALLQAAGGTLPVIKKNEQGAYVLAEDHSHHAPAPTAAAPAKQPAPAAATKPVAPAARPAAPSRTTPTAASTSGTDSSAQADSHRPAAEAQAATGMASAAPMSPAAATASPAAGAETVADLAPDASTELTPGAPRDARKSDATSAPTTASISAEEDKTQE